MEIADFLLARIAEDEAVAREAQGRSRYDFADSAFEEAVELADGEGAREVATRHIARHDPARVLAECEAKRRIVEMHSRGGDGDGWYACNLDNYVWPCDTLAVLARPYADHDDYRDEWAVS